MTTRILLVEDNDGDVYLFRKALTTAGLDFELTVIKDGGRAKAYVRGEGEFAGRPVPDLAILDLSLPKDDGLEVLEAIRQSEPFANMPIVIASSSPHPPARLEQSGLSVARYITKPLDLEEFMGIGEIVKEILARGR
jgi:CheY-like chemotaxis protein